MCTCWDARAWRGVDELRALQAEKQVHWQATDGELPKEELKKEEESSESEEEEEEITGSLLPQDLAKLGVGLTELSTEQADYIGVTTEGPYKPEHYRY